MSAGVRQGLPLDRPLEHAVAAAAEGARYISIKYE